MSNEIERPPKMGFLNVLFNRKEFVNYIHQGQERLDAINGKLNEREGGLDERENRLNEREDGLDKREHILNKSMDELNEREDELIEKEHKLNERENIIRETEAKYGEYIELAEQFGTLDNYKNMMQKYLQMMLMVYITI